MLLRQARRITCPLTGLVVCALLAGCMESRSASVGPGGALAPAGAQASDLTAHSPAPAVPRDEVLEMMPRIDVDQDPVGSAGSAGSAGGPAGGATGSSAGGATGAAGDGASSCSAGREAVSR